MLVAGINQTLKWRWNNLSHIATTATDDAPVDITRQLNVTAIFVVVVVVDAALYKVGNERARFAINVIELGSIEQMIVLTFHD